MLIIIDQNLYSDLQPNNGAASFTSGWVQDYLIPGKTVRCFGSPAIFCCVSFLPRCSHSGPKVVVSPRLLSLSCHNAQETETNVQNVNSITLW
jgi:hypothetical protein